MYFLVMGHERTVENVVEDHPFGLLTCVSVMHVIYSGIFEQNVITCGMLCQYRV